MVSVEPPKLKGSRISRDCSLEVTVSKILQYMNDHELHSATSACKDHTDKWKLAYSYMYGATNGPLCYFQSCPTRGREYVFIRKQLNMMIAELHIMRKEADASGKLPTLNADKGSEFYALTNAIKSSSDLAKKKDAENASKLRQSMENVETRLGLRSEGLLTPPPVGRYD